LTHFAFAAIALWLFNIHMPNAPRILAFSGSARRASLNKKLLAVVVAEVRAAGGEVTHLEINDYPLPLYHGDLEEEQGMPANANKLVELVKGHDALLVASPEYNSMITPLLKNTIDWCSRADDNPFEGRVAAVVSASPGPFGGVRSAVLARQLLMKLGCTLVPAECTLPKANEAFDENGGLKNPRSLEAARKVAAQLVRITGKLAG
jgi:chromate reductase